MTTREDLVEQISSFRAWAATYPTQYRTGEWEDNYRSWNIIYRAFGAYISTVAPKDIDIETRDDLVYIIARDNDSSNLIRLLGEHTDLLLALAIHALQSHEPDAKWQMAQELSEHESIQSLAEPIVYQYALDSEEYVRRRALLALARMGSHHVEQLAQIAWATNEEYSMMAALQALAQVDSPLANAYLREASTDPRDYLAQFARRILNGERPWEARSLSG